MAVDREPLQFSQPTQTETNYRRSMALVERAVAVLMAMAVVHVSNAAVYKVGESAGWTTMGNVDYKQWAITKTFQVGDVIRKFFFIFGFC